MKNRSWLAFWLLLGLGVVCLAPSPASAWWRQAQKRKVAAKEPTAEAVTLNGVVQRVTPTQIEILVDPPAKEDQKHKQECPARYLDRGHAARHHVPRGG